MPVLPPTYVEGFHDEELCQLMEYRNLGATGLQVSKVGFGCAALSDLYGNLDVDEAVQTIHKAMKSGINYFDTAPYYGQGRAEEILGMAFKTIPREAFYIATKVGRYEKNYENMFDFSAKKTRASVEKSLQLMGLDYVDVIQIHDIEFALDLDIIINECLPELEKLVKEGKARYIGITTYSLNLLKECVERAPGRINTVLNYARNTLMDDALKSYVDFFEKEKIGIVSAAAHAMGLLTNAGPQPWHYATEKQKEMCRKAAEICKEADVELGKLAMHYSMQLNGPATFLTGMQTRRLLDINLSAFYNGLSEREQEVLQLLRKNIFSQSINWGDVELERYLAALNRKN